MLQGRPLDPTSAYRPIQGDTTKLSVSRYNLLETAKEELLEDPSGIPNFRNPLEVDFYGEEVNDCGGPRKEFFHLTIRDILKDDTMIFEAEDGGSYRLTDRVDKKERKDYYFAGLICGMELNASKWEVSIKKSRNG